MQKRLLIIGTLTILLLAACQSVDDGSTKSSAPENQRDKAVSTSKVSITVPGENTVDAIKEAVINNKIVVLIDEGGFLPEILTAKVGDTLMINNSLDTQIDLYTTAEDSTPCPVLEATIEIPGLATEEIVLEKAAGCDIINQLNTDQKGTLTVE